MESLDHIKQERKHMASLFDALAAKIIMESEKDRNDLQAIIEKRIYDLDIDDQSKNEALVAASRFAQDIADNIRITIAQYTNDVLGDTLDNAFNAREQELKEQEMNEEADDIAAQRAVYYASVV